MGDLVDITTVPNQENIFYKITSGSLRFQVKGPRNARIGLAPSNCNSGILWFVIGQKMFTTLSKDYVQYQAIRTPNILSAQEFREFWIEWHDNILCLGRGYLKDPIIAHPEKTSHLKYVTFGVHENGEHSLQWRFEMPPLLEQLKVNPVYKGIPQWVEADTQLPDGALIGGFEKEILYIIRAKHHGSLTPGKFVPSEGVGYIPWGGEAHEKNEFEVLCGYDCIWLPCNNGNVLAGSVVAGYSESQGHETLYVGRARYKGHLIPGKVQPSHRNCYIPWDDEEIPVRHYEVLVVPHKKVQCANSIFVHDHAKSMHEVDNNS